MNRFLIQPIAKILAVLSAAGLLTAVSMAPINPSGTTRYVAPGGACGGHNPCYATFQAAVDAASHGDTILVAEGVYSGVSARGGHTQLVYLDKSITIRGGYTNAFTDPPNPAAHPAILDAQELGRVIYIPDLTAANIVLDGLQLTRGNGFEGLTDDNCGSAIRMRGSTDDRITIHHSQVFDHTAYYECAAIQVWRAQFILTSSHIHDNDGMGVQVDFLAPSVTLTNNTIVNNGVDPMDVAPASGAQLEADSITLTGNTFDGNGLHGAYLLSPTSVHVQGNIFSDNMGTGLIVSNGAGVITENDFNGNYKGAEIGTVENLRIFKNVFQSNENPTGAGLISSGAGLTLHNSIATVFDNLFTGNKSGKSGGAISSTTDIEGYVTTIRGNRLISNQSGFGGAMALSGEDNASLVEWNVISDNQAVSGGGVAVLERAHPLIQDNIFSANIATTRGGAVYCQACTLNLERNRFTHNMAVGTGNAIHIQWLQFSIYGIPQTESNLVNNLIYDHENDSTPTVNIHNSQVNLVNNTIIRNPASVIGVGVWVEEPLADLPASVHMTNTILAGHHTGVYLKNGSVAMQGTLWGGGIWANTADTYGPVDTGTVNFWGDPLFVDYPSGDYHISASSPARDHGVPVALTSDIEHEPRPHPDTGLVDIGADEYHLDDLRLYLPIIQR